MERLENDLFALNMGSVYRNTKLIKIVNKI